MRRLVLVACLALGGIVAAPDEASAWISGCSSAVTSTRYFGAKCTSGNARYTSFATCWRYLPSGAVESYRKYSLDWEWPGGLSSGSCSLGWRAKNPGCTQ